MRTSEHRRIIIPSKIVFHKTILANYHYQKKSWVVLGKSGLRVSELCLGAMTFGEDWDSFLKGASKEESKKIFNLVVKVCGICTLYFKQL